MRSLRMYSTIILKKAVISSILPTCIILAKYCQILICNMVVLYYILMVNFFCYVTKQSERFLGEYIADKRSQVVISTKYTANVTTLVPNVRNNPNAGGNHRKSLVENLDESLKRLSTGYIDLLYVHIWDLRTPIEETMRSLDDAVRSGKVLYVAISDSPGWVVSRANTIAELRGWSRFIGLQTRYNLVERAMEHEIQSSCAELDVGIIPWGCVAEGFLTGKYTRESIANIKKSGDLISLRNSSLVSTAENEQNWQILDEVTAIAAETKRSPVQIALNWISQKPGITSPLIGARTKAQLVENLKALEFKLTPEQMARLDAVSAPKEVPFPYSIYLNLEKLVGKTIQIPDKHKPVFNLGAQERWC
ncbi:aldo/keto reductase [Gigaspora margarita]|uniref:Aldo/keto reductase n=1 Tax=Gigaspora margarita TaxID=4874 RepID=A0A8H3WYG1_GIGMA|nr:aldo/keto reductase [Gigaspora margarita]